MRSLSSAIIFEGGTNSIKLPETEPNTWTIDMGMVRITDDQNVSWYFKRTRDTKEPKQLPWLKQIIDDHDLTRV